MLLLLLILLCCVPAIPRQSRFVSSTSPQAPPNGIPHCTESVDEVSFEEVHLELENMTLYVGTGCSECVRVKALRCPNVRDVAVEQCTEVPINTAAVIWRGFAHLLICEVRADILNAFLAEKMGLFDGSRDPEVHMEAFPDLTLSRGVELFQLDRWRSGLLLNPESMTEVKHGTIFTCGVYGNNLTDASRDFYLPLDLTFFALQEPPGFPPVNCRLEVSPPEISYSISSKMLCSLDRSFVEQRSSDTWLLEWCQFRCDSNCPHSCVLSANRSGRAEGAAEVAPQLQECEISHSDGLTMNVTPNLIRITHGSTRRERVLDRYVPAHHREIVHLPEVRKNCLNF